MVLYLFAKARPREQLLYHACQCHSLCGRWAREVQNTLAYDIHIDFMVLPAVMSFALSAAGFQQQGGQAQVRRFCAQ